MKDRTAIADASSRKLGPLPGVELHTKHRFVARFGENAENFLAKKHYARNPISKDYQAYSFLESDEAAERAIEVGETLGELTEEPLIASRATSVIGDGRYRQQFSGIMPPSPLLVEMKGLRDLTISGNDVKHIKGRKYGDFFLHCIDAACSFLLEGLESNRIQAEMAEGKYVPRVTIKRGPNRGDDVDPDFAYINGKEGNARAQWMISQMLEDDNGIYK